jgi:hypothetical protein
MSAGAREAHGSQDRREGLCLLQVEREFDEDDAMALDKRSERMPSSATAPAGSERK